MAGPRNKLATAERMIASSSKGLRGVPRVTIVGFGNWGTALALALHGAGVSIVEIVTRGEPRAQTAPNRKLVRALGARLTSLDRASFDADILWICTPDASIARVSAKIASKIQRMKRTAGTGSKTAAKLRPTTRIVFHSSGALASSQLAAFKIGGASLAAVHPLMTFPRRDPAAVLRARSPITAATFPLDGVPFAIQGEAIACRSARHLVRALHGLPFILQERDKPLYHAFGAFTSPLLVAMLTAATATGAAAGLNPREVRCLMRPIVERSVANFFNNGPEKSFSGPLARGDSGTVARHLAVLEKHPSLIDIYRQLSLYALAALPGTNKGQLRKLLSSPPRKLASSRRSGASTA
jgi:predicted short-subunit dehydrogenase-like oxidoreductase (DUF2520 family)